MNRLEVIATFSALEKLHELGSYDKLGEVIHEVLEEARNESKKADKDNK